MGCKHTKVGAAAPAPPSTPVHQTDIESLNAPSIGNSKILSTICVVVSTILTNKRNILIAIS